LGTLGVCFLLAVSFSLPEWSLWSRPEIHKKEKGSEKEEDRYVLSLLFSTSFFFFQFLVIERPKKEKNTGKMRFESLES